MSEGYICIRNLKLTLGGNTRLFIPNADIHPSHPTLILGPNGAGKSLLLRILHGLTEADEGEIVFPTDLGDKKDQAMVFQKPILFRRSVNSNIIDVLRLKGYNHAEAQKMAQKWLLIGELSEFSKMPARNLSGGEQQRLALTRALALRPKTLFLDEPSASLDPVATVKIEKLILETIKSGVKVIMVTHDQAQARRLGKEIILMHKGEIVAQDNKNVFFEDCNNPLVKRFLAGKPLLNALE